MHGALVLNLPGFDAVEDLGRAEPFLDIDFVPVVHPGRKCVRS